MSHTQPRRAGVVLLLLAALVLLAATLVVGGCGDRNNTGKAASPTPTADKFVGTWNADLAVTKAGGSYSIAAGEEGVAPGDTGFSGCTIEKSGDGYEVAGLDGGKLVFMTYEGGGGLPSFSEVDPGVATLDGDALSLQNGGSPVTIAVDGDAITLTMQGDSFTGTRE